MRELLKEHMQQNQDTEGPEIVEEIILQTTKLDFLIGCLTKLSRMESGILTVEPKLQSLNPLIEETVRAGKPVAEKKNITIIFSEKVEADAVYDLKWTREALENIVDNAVKYSSAGSCITLAVKPYEMYTEIAVIDEGIGISEEEIPKIFGRFFRGSQVHDQEGVGLGLFLAREIVRREDGYIRVKSQVDSGSTFSVFLKNLDKEAGRTADGT